MNRETVSLVVAAMLLGVPCSLLGGACSSGGGGAGSNGNGGASSSGGVSSSGGSSSTGSSSGTSSSGGSPDGGSSGACVPQSAISSCVINTDAGIGACDEFNGSTFVPGSAGAAGAVQLCVVSQGVFRTGPCPTAMRLGGCVNSCGTANEGVNFYYGPGAAAVVSTPMQVEQLCGLLQVPYVP